MDHMTFNGSPPRKPRRKGPKWPIIDTSNAGVVETAARIMEILDRRKVRNGEGKGIYGLIGAPKPLDSIGCFVVCVSLCYKVYNC